jgi:hypothetical protein
VTLKLDNNRPFGTGPGYCYWRGVRVLLVIAESLETVRLCVAPSLSVRRVKHYSAKRQAYFLTIPAKP